MLTQKCERKDNESSQGGFALLHPPSPSVVACREESVYAILLRQVYSCQAVREVGDTPMIKMVNDRSAVEVLCRVNLIWDWIGTGGVIYGG